MKRVPKVHDVGTEYVARCRNPSARVKVTAKSAEVTCNQCIYRMFANGELETGDPRITDNMRAYHAKAITAAKQHSG